MDLKGAFFAPALAAPFFLGLDDDSQKCLAPHQLGNEFLSRKKRQV
jgi:hypothetical protein